MSNNTITLKLNIADITNENGESYIGYGFTAYRTSDDEEIFKIEDLSADKSEVENLISLIIDNDISVSHFENIIDDFLFDSALS